MKTEKKLSWAKTDIENICGFNSKKFTRVNLVFTFILGLLLAAAFYLALLPLRGRGIQMIDMFFHGGEENRSSIPYYTVFLFCFSIAILFIKNLKLKVQQKALQINILPRYKLNLLHLQLQLFYFCKKPHHMLHRNVFPYLLVLVHYLDLTIYI